MLVLVIVTVTVIVCGVIVNNVWLLLLLRQLLALKREIVMLDLTHWVRNWVNLFFVACYYQVVECYCG